MLSKDHILAAQDITPPVEVHIPEWGGSVFVKMMTASERDKFELAHVKNPHTDVRARFAAYTVCDDKGNLLFDPNKDVHHLAAESASALDRIFAVATKLNKLGADDVEELKKTSSPIHSEDSPSVSHDSATDST